MMSSPARLPMPDFAGPVGDPLCVDCMLERVPTFGRVCRGCIEQQRKNEHLAAIERSWGSVPAELQWLSFDAPGLGDWVRDREAMARAKAAVGKRLVVLVGEAGAGKTSLGVCILRALIEQGRSLEGPWAAMWRARHSRFMHAYQIPTLRSEARLGDGEPSLITLARNTGALLLDELGDYRDPHQDLKRILHERHAEGRLTIVTTGLTQQQTADAFDGGVARRLFEDTRASMDMAFIEVRKVVAQ